MFLSIESLFSRLLSISLIISISLTPVAQVYANQQLVADNPILASVGKSYQLPMILGYKINPQNPLQIEFIVNKGSKAENYEADLMRSVNYFLASLTTPIDKIWVNLSPYESDRIIDQDLETTDMGRDLLSQDYLLKQLAASLTNPETPLGKTYWSLENSKSKIENRSDLSKIWISPDEAEVYDQNNMVVVTKASLKLESEDGRDNVLLPTITEDVNKGKNFARLRQIYNSIILAQTFKTKFINSLYKHYINQGNVNGVEIDEKTAKERIYSLYVNAFNKGAFNITKKEYDHSLNRKVKRQYFSGGIISSSIEIKTTDKQSSVVTLLSDAFSLIVGLFDKQLESIVMGNTYYNQETYKERETEAFEEYPILDNLLNTIDAKVLLVEDSVHEREFTKLYLQDTSERNHKIDEFEDGVEALEQLKMNSEYDAIITDLSMIKMDGDELIKAIREDLGLDIPIIVPTGDPEYPGLLAVADENVEIHYKPDYHKRIFPGDSEKMIDSWKHITETIINPRVAKNPIELAKQKVEQEEEAPVFDKKTFLDLVTSDKPMTILLAEDTKSMQKTLVKFLNKFKNNTVITADDGEEAYQILKERMENGESVDLIISDNKMPYMYGTVWLDKANKKLGASSIPKVIWSSTVDEDDVVEFCEENGVIAYWKEDLKLDLGTEYKVQKQAQTQSSAVIKIHDQLVVAKAIKVKSRRGINPLMQELVFESDGFKTDLDNLFARSDTDRFFLYEYTNFIDDISEDYIIRTYHEKGRSKAEMIGKNDSILGIRTTVIADLREAGVDVVALASKIMPELKVDKFLDERHVVLHKRDKIDYKAKKDKTLDGGIKMKDFRVTGMNESSLIDGLTVSPVLFENINPSLISFSEIGDAQEYLNN